MLNFDDIVDNLLEEALDPDNWWVKVIEAFNKSNEKKILPVNDYPTDTDLLKSIKSVISSTPSLNYRSYNKEYIPLLDLWDQITKTTIPGISINRNDVKQFIDSVQAAIVGGKAVNIAKIVTDWESRKDLSVNTYAVKPDGRIAAAETKRRNDVSKVSDTAFTTIEQLCILPALQQVIKRRTSAIQTALALKAPTQPFNVLINNIFNEPEKFASGQRPITSDFAELVDGNIHIRDIILLAIYSRELFEELYNYWTNISNSNPVENEIDSQNTTLTPTADSTAQNTEPSRPPVEGDTIDVETDRGLAKFIFKGGKWYSPSGKKVANQDKINNAWNSNVPIKENYELMSYLLTELGIQNIASDIANQVKAVYNTTKQQWIKDQTPESKKAFFDFINKGIISVQEKVNTAPAQPVQQTGTTTTPQQVNASFKLDDYVYDLLDERKKIYTLHSKNSARAKSPNSSGEFKGGSYITSYRPPSKKMRYGNLKNAAPAPAPEPTQTAIPKPPIYILRVIDGITETKEAIDIKTKLINLFKEICTYQKPIDGVLKRIDNVGAAAGSLAAIGGVKSGFSM